MKLLKYLAIANRKKSPRIGAVDEENQNHWLYMLTLKSSIVYHVMVCTLIEIVDFHSQCMFVHLLQYFLSI